MKIEVEFLEGKRSVAKFNDFEVVSDMGVNSGGQNLAPEPYDFFPVSTSLCVGHYVRSFCEARGIDFRKIKITQEDIVLDENNRFKKKFKIAIYLPSDFPSKYHKAVLAAAEGCTVKKVIEQRPEFELKVVTKDA